MNVGQINRAKTHCPAGHRYSPKNTARRPRGGGRFYRSCIRCERERSRLWREENPGYHAAWRADNASPAVAARKAAREAERRALIDRAAELHAKGLLSREIAAELETTENTVGLWQRERGLVANGKARQAAQGAA